MVKVVFFDIDGTLFSTSANRVPEDAREAVAALRARGIRVVIATGRHPIELDGAHLEGMAFDGYAAANGQMCLDGARQLFAGCPIPAQGTHALAGLYERKEMLLWFFSETESFTNFADEGLFAMAEDVSGVRPAVRPYEGETLYQAVAFVSEEDEPALAALLPGCSLQRWGTEGVDIIAESGGKVDGMKAFLSRFGCTPEECMAFGDQRNDLDMLRFAGIGVAMGNATPAVKQAADYVTASVDSGGVVQALEHFGMLERGWRTLA